MCVDRCKVAMNKKLERIEEYKPSQRTYETNVSKLDWNECNLEFNEEFQKILLSSLSEISLSEYPNIYNSELLDLLADYCNVYRENVQVFNGSDSALHYIFAAFLNPETKVLVYYPNYNQIQTFLNLYSENVSYSQIIDPFGEHLYDFNALQDYDVIYLSNPNNPTGNCISIDVIEELLANYKDKLFIIDEAYYEFSKKSCTPLALKFNNLIVTRTFSKGFSLASIRLGYICANKQTIELINKIRNTKDVNSFAQALGICALKNKFFIDQRIEKVINNREKFQLLLSDNKFDFIKSQANFVLIKVKDSARVTKTMLENNVLVRDRGMFEGLENTIRVTIGEWHEMEKIIKILLENE